MSRESHKETEAKSIYDFARIEAKWQQRWTESKLFRAPDNPKDPFYLLVMFAYPSGDIHMGHFRNYIIGDAIVHYQMMHGKDILHPFGWDAFGLPAEQAAIKRNLPPKDWTLGNIETSRSTLKKVGVSFDWEREVVTCAPNYYKWTQWLFVKLFENNLAYRKTSLVNFCEHCNTVLANEQVIGEGICWRCENPVIKKKLKQWYFRITNYAEKLLDGLDTLAGWSERVKTLQRNWIGKSVGCEIVFKLKDSDIEIPIFTTRPDTIFGVTMMAVAPDAELVEQLDIPADRREMVSAYIEKALKKTEVERQAETDDKDGVFTGLYAVNPLNGEEAQLWIADYVLASYGTGVVMGVPAHDQRDFLFTRRYDLPVKVVIKPEGGTEANPDEMTEAFVEKGEMCNCGRFDGLVGQAGIDAVIEYVKEQGTGGARVNYRLRDWLISRQRYWGAPIPIIHCDNCGEVAVPAEQLPVLLPDNVENFIPKGRSPLADVTDWVNVNCPKCGATARRDADTMDTFMCSAWYMLRYSNPHNANEIFSHTKVHQWLPVSQYIGGIDHATGHLIYFRFMTQFLHDIGLIDFAEPATRLFNHGMVNDDEGRKMSKSLGNVVSPTELMKEHGVDVCRLAMHFTAPADKEVLWDGKTITGTARFLERFYRTVSSVAAGPESVEIPTLFLQNELSKDEWAIYIKLNQTIKKVTEDIERMQFNTCIAATMEFFGAFVVLKANHPLFQRFCLTKLTQLLAPMAPHIAEEAWQMLGNKTSVFKSGWPQHDPEALTFDTITVAVQVNGKVRGELEFERGLDEETIKKLALAVENVKRHTDGKEIKKVIYVKEKLVSVVVR